MAAMARGVRPCGCAWEYRDARGRTMLVFVRRCDRHEPMCRQMERWELDLIPDDTGHGEIEPLGPLSRDVARQAAGRNELPRKP